MEKKKKRTKKAKVLPWVLIPLGAILFYVASGAIAAISINAAIFSSRSETSDSDKRIFKTRLDFPSLSKREDFSFLSDGEELALHLYDAANEKGTVLFAHGLGSTSDGPEAIVEDYFVQSGYDVYALDLTGSGESSGEGTKGLFQSAYDVKAAYDFLLSSNAISAELILVGYSWGGFGVAASLSLGVEADRLITFSAFDTPIKAMTEYAERYVGFIADFFYPPFLAANYLAYGDKFFLSSSKAVKEAGTKALIIQGEKDNKINASSLYKAIEESETVEKILLENATHQAPWISSQSQNYIDSLKESEEVDKEKTSILSEPLFTKISDFLQK